MADLHTTFVDCVDSEPPLNQSERASAHTRGIILTVCENVFLCTGDFFVLFSLSSEKENLNSTKRMHSNHLFTTLMNSMPSHPIQSNPILNPIATC